MNAWFPQRAQRHNALPSVINFGIACCRFSRQSDRERSLELGG